MSKTNVGTASFNHRTQLGHCLWRWLWTMRKRTVRIVIDRHDFAPELCKPTRNELYTSTVTTIDRDLQVTCLNGGNGKCHLLQLHFVHDSIRIVDGGLDLIPGKHCDL